MIISLIGANKLIILKGGSGGGLLFQQQFRLLLSTPQQYGKLLSLELGDI